MENGPYSCRDENIPYDKRIICFVLMHMIKHITDLGLKAPFVILQLPLSYYNTYATYVCL